MESISVYSSSPFFGLPVNAQLTTQMLLSLGFHVNYWEPIGLRDIHLIQDLPKILDRLGIIKNKSKTRAVEKVPADVSLIKTLAFPPKWNFNFLQREILSLQLSKIKSKSKLHIIFLPSFAPLLENLEGPIIYFVVDKYDENPGSDKNLISAWEEKIISRSAAVVTTSLSLKALYEKKSEKRFILA